MIHLHKWGVWAYLYTIKYYSEFDRGYPVKEKRLYERTCARCGAPQTKKVRV